jgi:hypothetical protein
VRRLKPYQDKHKRVMQNVLRRKEKERKEKEAKKYEVIPEFGSTSEDHELPASSAAHHPLTAVSSSASASNSGMKKTNTSKAASSGLLEKLDWKKAFSDNKNNMKGIEIYNLYTNPVENMMNDKAAAPSSVASSTSADWNELNKKDNHDAEQTGDINEEMWNEYTTKLFDKGTSVDTIMSSRINNIQPEVLENYPIAQLFVMDVYVQLPKPKGEPPNRKGSAIGAPSTAMNSVVFPVEIHQTVGIFPCETEKCPANLNCGLFEYEYFHFLYQQQLKKESDDASSTSSLTNSVSQSRLSSHRDDSNSSSSYIVRDKGWGNPDRNSGVSIGRTTLHSGLEFQFRMLGQWSNQEYLEKELPKKVKAWLGLPI